FAEGLFVITLTRGGQIKKTPVLDYQNYRDKGIIGVKIADDDQLLTATVTDGTKELLIATKFGKSIRFHEEQVRAAGRNTAGVKAIELEESDQVVGLAYPEPDRNQVLAICERGFGKRTALEEFRSQNRGGKGIILIDASERNGPVVGISMVKPEDEVVLITDRGQTIRTRVDEIRLTGRNAQGVRVMNVEKDERVVAMESVERDPDDELAEGDGAGNGASEGSEPSETTEAAPAEADSSATAPTE